MTDDSATEDPGFQISAWQGGTIPTIRLDPGGPVQAADEAVNALRRSALWPSGSGTIIDLRLINGLEEEQESRKLLRAFWDLAARWDVPVAILVPPRAYTNIEAMVRHWCQASRVRMHVFSDAGDAVQWLRGDRPGVGRIRALAPRLAPGWVAGAAILVGLAFLWWASAVSLESLGSGILVELAGSAFSFAAGATLLGIYAKTRRQAIHAPLRRQVLAALARRLSHVAWEVHWRISEQGWLSYGYRTKSCDRDPDSRGLAYLEDKVEEIRASFRQLGGSYHAHVPFREGEMLGGDDFVNALESAMGSDTVNGLRGITAPLQVGGEDNLRLLAQVEELINTSWLTIEAGRAARMGEMADDDFMRDFPEFLNRLVRLYVEVRNEWEGLPA